MECVVKQDRSLLTIAAYTIAVLAVTQMTWNSIPIWLKRRVSGGKKDSDDKEHKEINDDLTDPAVIWNKIQEVMKLASEITKEPGEKEADLFEIHAAFLSLLHLLHEIDESDPQFREEAFSKDGEEVPKEELATLLDYLDYAEWAYKESQLEVQQLLRPRNYKLIRFDSATEPGRVGHYIAISHEKKEVIIAIKGTSTLSDVFTDIISKAVPHSVEGGKEIRCHEGMYVAAKMMLDDTLHLIEGLFQPQGYKISVCGHSLGAGVSALLGIFLKQQMPDLDMKVYAFATPACCSFEASIECKDFLTTVVNNHDCVPRLSLMNLRMMKGLLELVFSKLKEKGMVPKNFSSTKKLVKDLMVVDSNLLIEKEELLQYWEEGLNEPRSERFIEVELYAPGRVISLWNGTKDRSHVGGRVTNSQSRVLRHIFIEEDMVSDHSCDKYRLNLQGLLEKESSETE